MEDNLIIYGRNAVLETLRANRPVNALFVANDVKATKGLGEHIAAAKKAGVIIKAVTPGKLDELSDGNRHGGIVAALSAVEYATVEDILGCLDESGSSTRVRGILIADGIEDPHNLGALIRTAEAAGFCGVIIPKRRSAAVTSAVYAASAGAAAHMKIARVTNLTDAIKTLKDNGVWVYGAESDGVAYTEVDFSGSRGVALVIGSEGQGLSRLVRENCDVIVSVPMFGEINSLNASVCGGVLMFSIIQGDWRSKKA